MAAAVPPVAVNNYTLPAPVLDGLLTKYKFISTRFAHDQESFVWQEKDPQFRNLAVICSGFAAHNNGTVYVNGEILSMLSEDPMVLEFDCSRETFDTVMSFAHSTHSSNRTVPQLLELLPLVRECKLPLLFDALVLCIVWNNGVPLREAFAVGLATESLLLVEYCFKHVTYAGQLRHLLAGSSSVFRRKPLSAFVAEVSSRGMELLAIMPDASEPDPAQNPDLDEFRRKYDSMLSALEKKLMAAVPFIKTAAPIWDVCLTFDDNGEVFASREILAHASRFFHHVLYGGFALPEDCWVPVQGVRSDDYAWLIVLLLPTFAGVFWRVTTAAPVSEPEPTLRAFKCQFFYAEFFESDDDPDMLLRLFKLAEYYQIPGLANYLTDVAVHGLPWRERLRFADSTNSREVMASLLTSQTVEDMRGSEDPLDDIGTAAKELMIEYLAHLFAF